MRTVLGFLARRGAFLALSALLLTACDDKDKTADPKPVTPPPVTPAPTRTHNKLTLEFQHNGPDGLTPIRYNTQYRSPTGFTYKLDLLTYYVSNIKLTRADGTIWSEPVSYHLLQVPGSSADNPTIVLDSVPVGNYTKLSFGIGVDATRNHFGDQPGDLSPNNGMLWTWATGYKFWVMEGTVTSLAAPNNGLVLHMGFDPNYRTQTLNLPTAATVNDSIAPQAHVFVLVNKIFGDPARPATVLNLNDPAQRTVMGNSAPAAVLATNISTAFRVAHVHND